MARSDRRGPASELLVREVARQLADAAPPAPEWKDLRPARTHRSAPGQPPTWPRLMLVAATTAFVVSGLWWLARPSPQELEPLDPPDVEPATSVAASELDPIADWRLWVERSAPIDVQLCLTRVVSNQSAASELPPPSARAGLPGDSPSAQQLAWHRPSQAMLAAVVAHPELDPTIARLAAAVVSSYEVAQASQFGDPGEPADQFATSVEAFLAARDANDSLRPDPEACWLESTVGRQVIASVGAGLDATDLLRCLAATQLDHSLLAAADEPATFGPVAAAAAASTLLWWPQGPPSELIDVTSEVEDAVLVPSADTSERINRTRIALAALAIPELTDECPLAPAAAPIDDAATNDQPPKEQGS